MVADRSDTRAVTLAWGTALLLVVGLIATSGFVSKDPDSGLYAGIAARLSSQPFNRWIAPEWWGFWSSEGLFFEHPVGIFIPPAMLARAGYPAEQAAYAVNALYQVLSFALVTLIARSVVSLRDARAIGGLLQLIPIAFVFRVRANQEYAVLAGTLLALYSTERSRLQPAWLTGTIAGFSLVLLVKGAFAFIVPLTCGIWLVARGGGFRRHLAAWSAVVAMPIVGWLLAWSYESMYVAATGQSFLDGYAARQLPPEDVVGGFSMSRTLYNAVWYVGRILWYAFPWSLLAVMMAAPALRKRELRPGGSRTPATDAAQDAVRRGAWFAIVASLALAGAFSLAHRKADRYIFPVYFIVSAAGAAYGIHRFPRLAALAARLDRPWVAPAIYFVLVLLQFATLGRLPQFTFWRT